MLVVSSREFREKQAAYFDRVDEGEEILVQRGKNRAYRIVPVTEDDSLLSKEEFFEKIDRSIKQANEGKVIRMKEGQSVADFLRELCTG